MPNSLCEEENFKKLSTLYCIIQKNVLYLHREQNRKAETNSPAGYHNKRKTTKKTLYSTMKKTVNVNIGSMPFTLDEDAYELLRTYFAEIRSRLPQEDKETAADIEGRMGEILRERVASPMYVISIETVQAAINRLGTPDCFGDRRDPGVQPEPEPEQPRKLYRSRKHRSIAGVCGGLADHFQVDSSIVRLVTLLLICFGGLSIWIYVILWIVLPEEPAPKFEWQDKRKKTAQGA